MFVKSTSKSIGTLDCGGQVLKVREDYQPMDPKMDAQSFHIRNIGRLIELNENDVRSEMSGIYINKSK